MVFFLGGIICGSIVAMVLVVYMNKTMALKNGKGKSQFMKKRGPSSGSPDFTPMDDEKCA